MRWSNRATISTLCLAALATSVAAGCKGNASSNLESKPREQQMKALEGDPAKIAEMAAKARGKSGPPVGSPATGNAGR